MALCLFISAGSAFGQSIYVAKGKEDAPHEPMILAVPYAFYNEGFGGAVAAVYGATGWPQKQSTFVATVIAGSNTAGAGYFLGQNFQMPLIDRLFLDPIIAISHLGTGNSPDIFRPNTDL